MGDLFRRIVFLLRRDKLERQLRNEMAFHREMMGEEAPRFGNPLALREEARDVWGWAWLDRLGQDARFAARLLRKSPLMALTAVAVLALGIGVNLTAFSLFNALVLAPMPGRESMYRFLRHNENSTSTDVPYPAAEFYRQRSQSLAAVLAYKDERAAFGAGNAPAEVEYVSGNYFRELQVSAAYGRLLQDGDDDRGAPPVVVLSYGFWRRQFGGDVHAIGQTVHINRQPATVIGVAPYDFVGFEAEAVDLWSPIRQEPYFVPGSGLLTGFNADGVAMFGRLRPGITAPAAEAELQPLVHELARQHPDDFWKNESLMARSAAHLTHLDSNDYSVVAAFAALVLLLLAITCGNLGNLLLAHAVSREREIGIRFAVGATRRRVFRQLLSESFLLAACGAAAGLLLSMVGIRVVLAITEVTLPLPAVPDWRMMAAAAALAILATVTFGVAPALAAARQAHRRSRARTIFIAAQVAASCVLLIVSGLLVRALQHALRSDPGFNYRHELTVDPKLYAHGYDAANAQAYLRGLAERLRGLPGVQQVGLAILPPFGNRIRLYNWVKPHAAQFYGNAVDENFLPSLGIAIVRGRNLRAGERQAVVVSQGLARKLWPGEDPLGKTMQKMTSKTGALAWDKDFTVVGVAAAARTVDPRDGQTLEAYYTLAPDDLSEAVLIVRREGDPAVLLPAIRDAGRSLDRTVDPEITLLSSAYRRKLADAQQVTVVVASVGGLAFFLAVVGVYGVVSYSVSQRTREFGIRMALGAAPHQIARAVLSQFLRPVAAALALGVAAAAGVSVALRSQLYGLSNTDPVTYGLVLALLLLVSGLAAAFPARRAARLDPMLSLRHE